MSQSGVLNLDNVSGVVNSAKGTAPITVDGFSGTPEDGNITIAITTPVVGEYGGTGVNNSGLTIDLSSGSTGYVLTSDSSGNATWQSSVNSAKGTAPITVNGASGTPEDGDLTIALTTPLVGQYGGTGVNNSGRTINLGSPTTGYVLTSDSSGNATWQLGGFTSIATQVFTYTGTPQPYAPTTGMVYCVIEVVGGGGGAGGCPTSGSGKGSGGGGGGAGGYSRGYFSAATVGALQTVTIGAGGSGGAAGVNNGSTGGTTSVGSLISATGGSGGIAGASGQGYTWSAGGAGGAGSSGTVNFTGNSGSYGYGWYATFIIGVGGQGGGGVFGGAPVGPVSSGVGAGAFANGNSAASTAYGSGGGGGYSYNSSTGSTGGNGAAGIVIVTEYIA